MGYYERVYSKVDYRIMIFLMPAVGLLLMPFALNIPLGMDFTGGTEVQLLTTRAVSEAQLVSALSPCSRIANTTRQADVSAVIQDIEGKDSIIIKTKGEMEKSCIDAGLKSIGFTDEELKPVIPTIFKAELGKELLNQGVKAILIAGFLMSVIIFLAYRSFIPSLAVMQAAFFDPLIAIGVLSLFGFELSLAGVAAMLMLVGYSVDTDILLNSKALRQQNKTYPEKLNEAFPTGITMTLSAIAAMIAILLVTSFVRMDTLHQIASVLLVGLMADMCTTWFTNAGIIDWYLKKHKTPKPSRLNFHLFRS
jgi:preprotein translocase subunit SecF